MLPKKTQQELHSQQFTELAVHTHVGSTEVPCIRVNGFHNGSRGKEKKNRPPPPTASRSILSCLVKAQKFCQRAVPAHGQTCTCISIHRASAGEEQLCAWHHDWTRVPSARTGDAITPSPLALMRAHLLADTRLPEIKWNALIFSDAY